MHLTPRQMAELRAEFAKGGLEASLLAAQLLEIVDKLQTQLQASQELALRARRDFADEEATALTKRLADAAASGLECPACHNAEARGVITHLKRVASGAEANAHEPAPQGGEARRRGAGRRS